MRTIVFDYTPQEDLAIAQESIVSVMTAALDKVKSIRAQLSGIMPGLIRGFSGNKDITTLPPMVGLTNEQAVFIKHLQDISFMELRELKAMAPDGLVVTYLNYLTRLEPAVVHVKEIIPQIVQPYMLFLAHLVSSKDAAMSTKDKQAEYSLLEKKRTLSYSSMSACFGVGKGTNRKVYDVVERNSDWATVFMGIVSLTNSLATVNRASVRELTKQCEDYLEIVYQAITKGQMENMSPETATTLAQGAYQVASELEYFSVVYYRILTLSECVNTSVTDICKILK